MEDKLRGISSTPGIHTITNCPAFALTQRSSLKNMVLTRGLSLLTFWILTILS